MEFQKVVTDFEAYAAEVIKHFLAITQMLLYRNGHAPEEHMKVLLEQEGSEGELKRKFAEVAEVFGLGDEREEIEAFFTAATYCVSILLC